MEFPTEKLSLWQIAFRLQNENPLAESPPLSVQDELIKLAQAVLEKRLPVKFKPGRQPDLFVVLAHCREGMFDKQQLDSIFVDKHDFAIYQVRSGNQKSWNIRWITDEQALEWARKSCWSMGEALWLLLGLVPTPVNTRDVLPDPDIFVGKVVDALHRAVLAEDLNPCGQDKHGESVFRPADIVRAVKSQNVGMWEYWEQALLEAQTGMSTPVFYGNAARVLAEMDAGEDATFRFPEPIEGASPGTGGEKTKKESLPQGLTTGQIAVAFEDVYWSYEQWKSNLGDCPKWLKEARMTRGARGKDASTWDPVELASQLLEKDSTLKIKIDQTFKNKLGLAAWSGKWDEYKARLAEYSE